MSTLHELEAEVCSCMHIAGMWAPAHLPECPALVIRQEWARQKVAAAFREQPPIPSIERPDPTVPEP